MGSNSRRINFVGLTNTLLGLRIHFVVCDRHVQHLTLRSYPCPQGEETCNLHCPSITHSKGKGSLHHPAGDGGCCYASASAAAPACIIATSCCGSVGGTVAADASALRLGHQAFMVYTKSGLLWVHRLSCTTSASLSQVKLRRAARRRCAHLLAKLMLDVRRASG